MGKSANFVREDRRGWRRRGAKEMTAFCSTCVLVRTAQSLGEGTHAVATRPKWVSQSLSIFFFGRHARAVPNFEGCCARIFGNIRATVQPSSEAQLQHNLRRCALPPDWCRCVSVQTHSGSLHMASIPPRDYFFNASLIMSPSGRPPVVATPSLNILFLAPSWAAKTMLEKTRDPQKA